jgi:hypothetical protein
MFIDTVVPLQLEYFLYVPLFLRSAVYIFQSSLRLIFETEQTDINNFPRYSSARGAFIVSDILFTTRCLQQMLCCINIWTPNYRIRKKSIIFPELSFQDEQLLNLSCFPMTCYLREKRSFLRFFEIPPPEFRNISSSCSSAQLSFHQNICLGTCRMFGLVGYVYHGDVLLGCKVK